MRLKTTERVRWGHARDRIDEAYEQLRGREDVLGVGVGLRRRAQRLVPEVCFVVHVAKKLARVSAARRIPANVEGFATDVIQRGRVELAVGAVGAGDRIRATDRDERGRLGPLARTMAGELVGLTAMHVLIADAMDVQRDVRDGISVAALQDDGTNVRLGPLLEGELSARRDLAVVRMRPSLSVASDPWRPASNLMPCAMEELAPRERVAIALPHDASGYLESWPIQGFTFNSSDSGSALSFDGLVRFALKVEKGDSGAAIVRAVDRAPIALLTALERVPQGDRVATYAYGFPLRPEYADRGMMPMERT